MKLHFAFYWLGLGLFFVILLVDIFVGLEQIDIILGRQLVLYALVMGIYFKLDDRQ